VMSLDVRAKHSEIGERHFVSRPDFTSLPALICLVISFVVFGISIGFLRPFSAAHDIHAITSPQTRQTCIAYHAA
jgi:hypothetical protein